MLTSILELDAASVALPPLIAIAEAPIIRPDGTIRTLPGYDPATSLYYAPEPCLQLPAIPDQPTSTDVDRAREALLDTLADFPFVDPASRANALAMILTAVVRRAIAGQVPLAVVDATTPGTGKGLLVSLAAIIATGRPAASIPWPDNEDEARKALTASLAEGATLLAIDNIEGPLGSRQRSPRHAGKTGCSARPDPLSCPCAARGS